MLSVEKAESDPSAVFGNFHREPIDQTSLRAVLLI